MNNTSLSKLQIDPARKRRPGATTGVIFAAITLAVVAAVYFAWPRPEGERRVFGPDASATKEAKSTPPPAAAQNTKPAPARAVEQAPGGKGGVVLTVSGYIVNRERIELSPRFPAVVKWIGVKKGDRVAKDQTVVLLDDAEQKARLLEVQGAAESARVALARAELNARRIGELHQKDVASQDAADQARLDVEGARAALRQAEGSLSIARINMEWTVIKSPIDGVVLEKLVEPNELVMPQSFGGPRGPSTALVAIADPNDLQVEIDVNESDLAKIMPGQKCRVSPEAYPDRHYAAEVAEISPEANRSKGTLQIKVQIENPDKFLTPELTARVEFLAKESEMAK